MIPVGACLEKRGTGNSSMPKAVFYLTDLACTYFVEVRKGIGNSVIEALTILLNTVMA